MIRAKPFVLLLMVLVLLAGTILPVFATGDSGQSGSNTGGGASGGITEPTKGNLTYSSPGITMQVVLYPYGESYNRVNSYENVVGTVQSYKDSQGTQTVFDGVSITKNTFVGDLGTGRVYRLPNLDTSTQTGRFLVAYSSGTGFAGNSINAAYYECVSGLPTYSSSDYGVASWYTVTMPEMNNVEKFLQRIIFGNEVSTGAWDVDDVALKEDGEQAETLDEDVSTFAETLRYLGCDDVYIKNYLDGYNQKLDIIEDADVLIPTIIWSYVVVEGVDDGEDSESRDSWDVKNYEYFDDWSEMSKGQIYRSFNSDNTRVTVQEYSVYTVGDIAAYGNSIEDFHAWWKTNAEKGTGQSSATWTNFNDIIGLCEWPIASSASCVWTFGKHTGSDDSGRPNHTTATERNYGKYSIGSGYINFINADGVDEKDGNQYYFRGYWTPYGSKPAPTQYPITITKEIDASDECIAQIKDNPLYSLAGAVYEVSIDGTVVETLTTNASGKASSTNIYDIGTTFTVREIQAPPGFLLNTTEYTFTITAGSNNFLVSDEPLLDPPFAITKVDKDTTTPQGDTSFSGAIFKWEYYTNWDWSGTPLRSWHFKTNEQGYAFYHPDYLAPDYTSDNLYLTTAENYQIPLGTIKITELKNSLGYIVMPQPLYCSIVADPDVEGGVSVVWTDESLAFISDMTSGNFAIYEPIDESLFGSLTVDKIDAVTGTTPQGGATLEKAKFQVINNSANSVKIGDFDEAAPGEVCYEFYTDAAGHFETGSIFPLGTYTVKEAEAPEGYTLNESWEQSFTVSVDQQDFAFTTDNDMACPDTPIMGGIRVIKQNSVTGEETGSDALLEDITFSVISDNDNPIIVEGETYEKGDTVLTLEVKWNDSQWTAESAEGVLPYGAYIVKENASEANDTMANDFYMLNTEEFAIKIEENLKLVDVTVKNEPLPGEIYIEKVNLEGEHLAGAKFLLEWSEDGTTWEAVTYSDSNYVAKGYCNAENLIDGCLTTDDTGLITFTGLYPGLQYRVSEIAAPNGYIKLADYAFVGELQIEEGMEVHLTVVNSRGYVLPSTGIDPTSNEMLIAMGAAMTVLAFAMLLFFIHTRPNFLFNGKPAVNIKQNERK